MKLSTLLLLIGATAVGIHLNSEEGAESKKKLKEQIDNITPVINDLFKKLEEIILNIDSVKSDEIKANVQKGVQEVKKTIAKVDAKKVGDATEEAIKVASKKIRDIRSQIETAEHYSDNYEELTVVELRKKAKRKKITLKSSDKKKDIILKLRTTAK